MAIAVFWSTIFSSFNDLNIDLKILLANCVVFKNSSEQNQIEIAESKHTWDNWYNKLFGWQQFNMDNSRFAFTEIGFSLGAFIVFIELCVAVLSLLVGTYYILNQTDASSIVQATVAISFINEIDNYIYVSRMISDKLGRPRKQLNETVDYYQKPIFYYEAIIYRTHYVDDDESGAQCCEGLCCIFGTCCTVPLLMFLFEIRALSVFSTAIALTIGVRATKC